MPIVYCPLLREGAFYPESGVKALSLTSCLVPCESHPPWEKLFHKRDVLLLLQVLQTGLYKLCHLPSRMGEHGEHWEHKQDGKHQFDNLKHSTYDSKHSIRGSKHSFCQPDDSTHSLLQHFWRQLKKSPHMRLENMILGQLRMGEHEVKCRALTTQLINAMLCPLFCEREPKLKFSSFLCLTLLQTQALGHHHLISK